MMEKNPWQNSLAAFLEANPDLPAGPDTPEPAPEETGRFTGRITVAIERKGRAGKTVTRISGFEGDGDLEKLAADLKRSLGTGGSTEGSAAIILQGDRRADATRWLIANGYKARSV